MTRVRSKERNKAKKISISINNPNTSPSSVNKKGESIALNVTRDKVNYSSLFLLRKNIPPMIVIPPMARRTIV